MKLGLGLGFSRGGISAQAVIDDAVFRTDASDNSSYTLGTGTVVDTIHDLSGNNYDFDFVGGKAIVVSGAQNGLDYFDFDTNIAAYRNSDGFARNLSAMTVTMVLRSFRDMYVQGTTNTQDLGALFSIGSWTGNQLLLGYNINELAGDGIPIVHYSGAGSVAKATGVGATYFNIFDSDCCVLTFTVDANGTNLYRNGHALTYGHPYFDYDTTGSSSQSDDYSPATLGVSDDWMAIGAIITAASGTLFRDADFGLCEMFVHDKVLSSAERNALVNNMVTKWGAQRESADVFIGAGQSNMAGTAAAPTAYQSDDPGSDIIFNGNIILDFVANGANHAQANGNTQHGPMIPLSRKHNTDTGANYVIKYGIASTSLAVDWKPTPTYGTRLQELLDRIDSGVNSVLKGNGRDANIVGFLWAQGESDAQVEAQANAYEDNLRDLISVLRPYIGADTPFVIARIGAQTYTYKSTVNAAIDAVAADTANVYTVNTDALTLADANHYDSAGYISLGEAALAAMLTGSNQTAS